MRRLGTGLLGLAASAILVVGAMPATEAQTDPVRHVTLLADEVLSDDGRLHELTLHSETLGRQTRVRILLPAGYDDPAKVGERYPVLLLVHGANSNERSWTRGSDIEGHTADDDLIVVMPEGGVLGFYSDWLDGPAWETYHLDELLPWIESTYRAVGTREGRAVAGVSMGGFGAMSYAVRNPDRFIAVASFSGVVDLTGLTYAETLIFQALVAPEPLWGSFLTHEANWRTHNPADLAGNLHGLDVHHITGTGVPCPGDNPAEGIIEAIILVMNASLDHRLTEAGVPHEYLVELCGTHELRYPDRYVARWLPRLMATFADPPPRPAAFDFRSAEPRIDVWDWSFTAHRPAIEFLDLTDVSPAGLTATGSGLVDVVTAAAYTPGSTYTLSTENADALTLPVARVPVLGTTPLGPAAAATATADADGRLRFTLDLGPAHTANQFSPDGIVAEALALGSYFRTATVAIAPTPGGGAADPNAPAPGAGAAGPDVAHGSGAAPRAATGGALPATGGSAPPWVAAAAIGVLLVGRLVLRRPSGRAAVNRAVGG